eukprot:m.177650 g.177650  ORF g.177650 m.177650 type:complete len:573 (+) comp14391_c0_seq1:249-1967(+)
MTDMTPEDLSTRLRSVTADKMAKFDALRSGSSMCPFWDIIVLTATDAPQAESYSMILKQKCERREIPEAKYHVFADPPGPKIGNGGATMFALGELEKLYPGSLEDSKVLLIHAGGFSKRLPNVSVTGKIFAVLPFGDPVFTMLEMKLASYIEFPSRMKPGVFVTCADDIELIDGEGELEFTSTGFTALGHPSTLEIGTTHGVFILDEASKKLAADPTRPPCTRGVCTRFTHKPSVERMKALSADIPGSELVYTDSAYYFDRPTSLKLQAFYAEHAPLTVEIDAYGDFLQALGPASTDEYTRDDKNVIVADDALADIRLKLYHHLKATPLNVILCNVSKFYHIGTLPEFLFHYCTDGFFRGETSALHAACVSGGGEVHAQGYTLIHSVVSGDAAVGKETVVEYSTIEAGARIGSRCLVSNTHIASSLTVPDAMFLHTTKVKNGFVTIVFGTAEDLKTGAPFEETGAKLTYCGARLDEALSRLACSPADLWPDGKGKCTLWKACAFPVFPTVAESVAYAVSVATTAQGPGQPALIPPFASLPRLNMEGILAEKDLEAILSARETLRQTIVQGSA